MLSAFYPPPAQKWPQCHDSSGNSQTDGEDQRRGWYLILLKHIILLIWHTRREEPKRRPETQQPLLVLLARMPQSLPWHRCWHWGSCVTVVSSGWDPPSLIAISLKATTSPGSLFRVWCVWASISILSLKSDFPVTSMFPMVSMPCEGLKNIIGVLASALTAGRTWSFHF